MTLRHWRLLTGLALVLLLGTALSFPSVHWRLVGWARGEAFYQGRPTSYWERECPQWELRRRDQGTSCIVCRVWVRNPSWFEQRLGGWLGKPAHKMPLVEGDVAALPVLVELMRSDDPPVLSVALDGVSEIMGQHRSNFDATTRATLMSALQEAAGRPHEEGRMAAELFRNLDPKPPEYGPADR